MGACAKQEEIIFFVVCPFQRDFVDRDLPFIMMLSEIEQEGAGGGGGEGEEKPKQPSPHCVLGSAGEGWEVAQVGACLACPKLGVPCPHIAELVSWQLWLVVVSSSPAVGLGHVDGGRYLSV